MLTGFEIVKPGLALVMAGLTLGIGLGSLYPLVWLNMFLVAPTVGRHAAHEPILTEILTYLGVGALLAGLVLLFMNLFFELFSE